MHKYRDHETHLMHAAVWSGMAIVLTLLGAVAWGIILWQWWTDVCIDEDMD